MEFRTDINGLRAIAVITVVLYHFGVPGFSGGFIGVDVFFVISGYLMTKIIFTESGSGQFFSCQFLPFARSPDCASPRRTVHCYADIWLVRSRSNRLPEFIQRSVLLPRILFEYGLSKRCGLFLTPHHMRSGYSIPGRSQLSGNSICCIQFTFSLQHIYLNDLRWGGLFGLYFSARCLCRYS